MTRFFSHKPLCDATGWILRHKAFWIIAAGITVMVFGCSENKLDEAQVKKEPVQPQVIWMMPPAGQVPPQPAPVQPMPPQWQSQSAPATPPAPANMYQGADDSNPWARRPVQPQQGKPTQQSGWNSNNWQTQQQQYAASSTAGGRFRPLEENKNASSGPYPATAPASPNPYVAPYDRATGSSQRPGNPYPGTIAPYGMGHPYGGVAPYATPALPGYYGNNMVPGAGWPMIW